MTLALAFASVTKRDRAAGMDGITTQAMRQREAEELPVIERLFHLIRAASRRSPLRSTSRSLLSMSLRSIVRC